MSRWASAANEAAAELDNPRGCFLLDLSFASGHVRANDSSYDFVLNGDTYFGLGEFGAFDAVTEDTNAVAYGVRFELAGIDSGLLATLRTERYQGRPATLYVAMLTEQWAFVDAPEVVWSGVMDTMDVVTRRNSDGTEYKVIVLQCEHRLRQACPNSRFCDAEQKGLHPGDKFFQFAHLVDGYVSDWGGKATRWISQPGGGYNPQ